MTYELEPLYIELTAPKGAYEVTLTINAESDCVFSVFEENFGTVRDEFPIKQNTSEDVIFTTKSCGSIVIEIYCDGNITATALATCMGG